MKKAWLYARFSSNQQADGDSIRRQTTAASAWCKTHGIELQATTFADLGVSGWKSIKRPMFEELLKAIEQGKIPRGSYILFESTDRLSRRGWRYTQDLIRKIVCANDCQLVILDKNQTYTKDNINDVVQNIVLMIGADLAEKESQRKSDLVAAAYARKRVDGDISRYPFWVDKVDDQFVLNDNADTIKQIIDLRLKGVGALGVAAELNRMGIKSPRGANWGHTTIRSVLSNPAIYGTKDFYTTKSVAVLDESGNDVRQSKPELLSSIANVFPALCDFTTWQVIQIAGEKRGRKAAVSPFQNIIFCKCGAGYGTHIGSAGERYRKCSSSKVSACTQVAIRNFDDTLIECLGRITYQSTEPSEVKNELPELVDRLQKLEQVKDSLLAGGAVDAIAGLYIDIANLKDRISTARKVIAVPTTEIKSVFVGTIDEQRLALKRVVKKVTVSRSKNLATIRVELTNGHKRVFGVNVGTGRGKSGINTIISETDTEKFLHEVKSINSTDPYAIDYDE